MLLRDLDDAIRLFKTIHGSFVGIGITAFSRITPAYFISPYHIACYKNTSDLDVIRTHAEVISLMEEMGAEYGVKSPTSSDILHDKLIIDYINRLDGDRYLLLYQSYKDIELLAKIKGWKLISNPESLRTRLGDRMFFRNLVNKLGLPKIPCLLCSYNKLYQRDYEYWKNTIGGSFVIRLLDIKKGGGRGTFFIKGKEDYERVRELLKHGRWRGVLLKNIFIQRYIDGIPVSVALCITVHGVLISCIPRQLIDLPYCFHGHENGVFCGHSWGEDDIIERYRTDIQRQAHLIGEYIREKGYRGIMGIDFILDQNNRVIYPLEINARLTGAFPMLDQLYMKEGIIPMHAFHILEFLKIPYNIRINEINRMYSLNISGGHIIVFARPGKRSDQMNFPLSGRYKLDSGKGPIKHCGKGLGYEDLRNKNEFLIIDGPPSNSSFQDKFFDDPFLRICRILFPYPIHQDETVIENVVNNLYQS